MDKKSVNIWLLALLGFHTIGHLAWHILNNAPPAWDEANHTRISFWLLNNFQLLGELPTPLLLQPLNDPYGPLMRLLTTLVISLAPSIKLAQISGPIFFILSVFMTYKLGGLLYSRWVGLIGAFIFSFFLSFYDYSRWFLLDIPLTFFVLFSCYLIFKSDHFKNKKYTLFAFLVMSLGILAKIQTLIYLIFPVFFAFLSYRQNLNARIKNIFLGLCLSIPLVGVWLFPNLNTIRAFYGHAVKAEPFSDPTRLSEVSTWLHYLKLFINYEAGFFVFLLLLIPLTFYLLRKSEHKFLMIGSILFYYAWFTIMPNKDMRYLFPILPLVALICAKGFEELSNFNKKVSNLLLLILVFVNVTTYLSLSFGFPIQKGAQATIVLPGIQDISYINFSDYPVRKFDPNTWPNEMIIKDISRFQKEHRRVLLGIDSSRVNNSNLAMYMVKNKITNLEFTSPYNKTKFEDSEIKPYVETFDYAIVPQEDVNPYYLFNKIALDQIRSQISNSNYQLIKTYNLPDNTHLLLYKIK